MTAIMFMIGLFLCTTAGVIVTSAYIKSGYQEMMDDMKEQVKAAHKLVLVSNEETAKWRTEALYLRGEVNFLKEGSNVLWHQ